jgi:hypothetical protein
MTPGCRRVLILSQALLGPDRYGCSRCFEKMPSSPHLAGVRKDFSAIAFEMPVVLDPGRHLRQQFL